MRKTFRMALTVMIFVAMVLTVTAQTPDSTQVVSGGGSGIWDFLVLHKEAAISAILSVYELIVRLYPTAQSWSILTWIIRFLNSIVPDNAKGGDKALHI